MYIYNIMQDFYYANNILTLKTLIRDTKLKHKFYL